MWDSCCLSHNIPTQAAPLDLKLGNAHNYYYLEAYTDQAKKMPSYKLPTGGCAGISHLVATPDADGGGGSYSLNELESSEVSIAVSCAPDASAETSKEGRFNALNHFTGQRFTYRDCFHSPPKLAEVIASGL